MFCIVMKRRDLLFVGVLLVPIGVGVALAAYSPLVTMIGSPGPCPLPAPPINLRTASGSGELFFMAEYSSYKYSDSSEQAPVSDLRYELALYREGDDYQGSGEIFREGRLDTLSTSGDFQFHDMVKEGYFSASNAANDFFILKDPLAYTIQLRVIDPSGKAIAWNPIVGCV